jgi:hypothetical protein
MYNMPAPIFEFGFSAISWGSFLSPGLFKKDIESYKRSVPWRLYRYLIISGITQIREHPVLRRIVLFFFPFVE